jgi:ABC-2 type transport system ATP-binding protein
VRVAADDPGCLDQLLRGRGAVGESDADDILIVTGMGARDVGIIAGNAGITLYELSPRTASLEEAFMELTRDASEYHAGGQLASTSQGAAA